MVAATGALEPRNPATRRPRPAPRVLAHLASPRALRPPRPEASLEHHLRVGRPRAEAGEALRAVRPAPDLVLQNGALFAPGLPPPLPYALLLDHTRALAQASPAWPRAGLAAPPDYGPGWRSREAALYRGASVIATFSANVARSLERDYGVDPARIAVVGAGANVFPAAAPRRDDGRTVLFIGKDFGRKGGPVLLDAFARLRRPPPRARLSWPGRATRRACRRAPSTSGRSTWRSCPRSLARRPCSPADAARAVRDRLPRRDGLRRPVRRHARRGGARDRRRRRDGAPVPPGDAVALEGALARLLSDPLRARAMGARGRARVAPGSSGSHVAARLERALVRPCAGRGAWPRAAPDRG